MEEILNINNLNFSYENKKIFSNLNLKLYTNNCYLLCGLNGCGKSTLLKIIGGKVLCNYDSVKVLNLDPFRDTTLNKDITFVNNEWGTRTVAYSGYNIPLQSELIVKDMMLKIKEEYPERNQELIDVLDINVNWKLNSLSEGQRKRVQLYLNLIKPFKICLLDEITVNLDILVKDKFMNYLKKQSLINKCCIIYVTHIFDGLDDWFTNIIYMKKDRSLKIINKNDCNDVYKYLLNAFKKEYVKEDEKEENEKKILKKNAGGYSNGVLINYKI